jgi:UrcA family protein
MTKTLGPRLLGLIWAAAAVVVSTPVAAQNVTETNSVHVNYADLDITHAEGAKALLGRIKAAAGRVCGDDGDAALRIDHSEFVRCRSKAIQRAVVQVNSPMVMATAGYADPTIVLAQR